MEELQKEEKQVHPNKAAYDKKKAQKEKEANKIKEKKEKSEKPFVNPMSTLWGKIIIIILTVGMFGGSIASLIYLIIKSMNA